MRPRRLTLALLAGALILVGAVLAEPGERRWEKAAASPDGRWQVLLDRQAGPTITRLLIRDRKGEAAEQELTLRGRHLPEILTDDGRHLFLAEYLGTQAQGRGYRYRVRLFDLETRRFQELLGPDKRPLGEMSGQPLKHVLAGGGTRLVTLYQASNGRPFLHVLRITGTPFAYCLDLPEGFAGPQDVRGITLSLSTGGERLTLDNPTRGTRVEVDILALEIVPS